MDVAESLFKTQPLPAQKTLHISFLPSSLICFLFCSHLLCMCFEDHSMGRDLTSTKALLSPSILLYTDMYFTSYSIPFLHPLFSLWLSFFLPTCSFFFTFLSLSTLLSLCSLLFCFAVSLSSITLSPPPPPPFLFLALHQVPGQLHGRRQGRLHERESSQRHAHHHPAQKVHGAHQDHLPTGEETQTGIASSNGGRRRPGQPTGWGRSSRSSVPRVRCLIIIFLNRSNIVV